jgi:SnoaL-like domain
MTLEELLAREGIRKTMAAYTMAGDRLKTDDFIAVFTEEAVLETDGVPEADAFRYEGRAAISGWITRWLVPADPAPAHQASFIRHHLSTCQIELTGPDAARARTYWTAYTDIGPDHCGCYLDVFRRTGDLWLIAHRRIRLDWRSGASLYTTAVERTRG